MHFFTVIRKVYRSAEENCSTVDGTLESMLLRGLPVNLLCMLLQTITPGVCFITLGTLEFGTCILQFRSCVHLHIIIA